MWVTVEGINGVGKTHLTRLAAQRLGCRLVGELTDASADRLPRHVIEALASSGTFLRTGHPLTETLALMALKVREYEHVAEFDGLVLEDRGIDTVAVYQAIILGRGVATVGELHALADRIYATTGRWRPLPDRTVLLVDDIRACIERYEKRVGTTLSATDHELVADAAGLYSTMATRAPDRFVVIDCRGRDEEDVLAELCRACTEPVAGVAS